MQDDYDFVELNRLKKIYMQNRDKGIPMTEMFTQEEHLYLMKYIFEYVLRDMGYERTLTYDKVLYLLKIISDDRE